MFFHSCWWSFFFGPEENSSSIRLKNPFKSKRVEWLEVVILQFLFLIFKIGHIAVDQMYFQKFIAKKSAIFASRPAHARQSFHIQKFTGALKINIFFLDLQILSFYFKEQSPKRKLGIKFGLIFFFQTPQSWKN